MKNIKFICIGFMVLFGLSACASDGLKNQTQYAHEVKQNLPVEDEIQAFIPKEMRLLAYKIGDLNRDNRLDAVVILEQNVVRPFYGCISCSLDAVVILEQNAVDSSMTRSRRLLILLRNNNGQLISSQINNNVIACSNCGLYGDDPFLADGLSIEHGQIHIKQYFDLGFHPSVALYRFKYDVKSNDFKTVLARHIMYSPKESGNGYDRRVTNHIQEYGDTLATFNPHWVAYTSH